MEQVTAQDYLRRIGYEGSTEPTADTLRRIVEAHLSAVPFDNLDMLHQMPLDLSKEALWDKIVKRRRGGICHELNNSLCYLLRDLGYEVHYRSARVDTEDDELEHCILRVLIDGTPWLADVGFGSHVVPALRLETGEIQEGYGGRYQFQSQSDGTTLLLCQKPGEAEFRQLYVMYSPERSPEDFLPHFAWYAAPGASIFSSHYVIIRTTPEARYALVKDKLTITPHGGTPEITPAPDNDTKQALLQSWFGIKTGMF